MSPRLGLFAGSMLGVLLAARSVSAACVGGTPNHVLEPPEQCDDGNTSNQDNCLNDCTLPFCGDGVRRTAKNCGGDATRPCATDDDCIPPAPCTAEECDDGNSTSCDGCSNCRLEFCGDGMTCPNQGEQCDDGNNAPCDGCSPSCQTERCGDGTLCPSQGEQCDPPSGSGPCAACSATCQLGPRCGDGVVAAGCEECDAGTALCTSSGPANGRECGTVAGKQGCDADGGTCGPGDSDVLADTCRTTCRNPSCGDGVLDAGESCDDRLDSGTPGVRDPADDLDNCPNGPNAITLGIACQGPNTCGDGLRLQIDSRGRCVGNCTGTLEQCDNGNAAVKTCRNIPTRLCTVDGDCGLNGICGNSDTRPDACRTSCANPSCGDDVRDAGEVCDEGEGICESSGPSNGKDCSTASGAAACTADAGMCVDAAGSDAGTPCTTVLACNSDVVPDACRARCGPPHCSDGVLDTPEECDHGAQDGPNRNCTDACKLAVCGDGKVRTDGNCGDATLPCDTDSDCTRFGVCIAGRCGGVAHPCTTNSDCADLTRCTREECDDGNHDDTDNCRSDCTFPTCGDGFVRTVPNCGGDAGQPCTSDADCGGQTRCTVEQCDDGNAANDDGCDSAPTNDGSFNCSRTGCGNGILNRSCGGAGARPCSADADCASLGTCTGGRCGGSGPSCAGDADCAALETCVIEACDDGNQANDDGCDTAPTNGSGLVCIPTGCGNRVLNRSCGGAGLRPCSKDTECTSFGSCVSNRCAGTQQACATAGDCASLATCVIEGCDDGNTQSLDGCSSECCLEAPGPAGTDKAAKFAALECLRGAMHGRLAALGNVPDLQRRRLIALLDKVGQREDQAQTLGEPRACGLLRSATRIMGSIQRRIDADAQRGEVPPDVQRTFGVDAVLLQGWHTNLRGDFACGG